MPIYAYKCRECGHSKDVFQKMNAPAPACPHCHKESMQKQVTSAAFKLKGSGWYETDFKNKKKDAPAASSASEAKASTSKPEKKPSAEKKATT